MTNDELRDTMELCGLRPRLVNRQWQCRCPVHDDSTPSLRGIVAEDGRLLLHCFAGCPFGLIVAAMGLAGRPRSFVPPPAAKREPEPNRLPPFAWRGLCDADAPAEVERRERSLGIPLGGLRRVGAVWAASLMAMAAPMYESPGAEPIGIRLRADDGRKWAVLGSRNGLFAPATLHGVGPLYLPEGLTDTACMVGLGFDAIGRPSCTGGRAMVREYVAATPRRLLVVVSDADEPGRRGADLLAGELTHAGHRAKVLPPPPGMKDVREWCRCGANAASIRFATDSRTIWRNV